MNRITLLVFAFLSAIVIIQNRECCAEENPIITTASYTECEKQQNTPKNSPDLSEQTEQEISDEDDEERSAYEGRASWYGPRFWGRKMANGRKYNSKKVFVAHKELPLGTLVRVTNLINGKEIVARVTDRGPYIKDRIIDLSYRAAKLLGAIKQGVIPILLEIIRYPG